MSDNFVPVVVKITCTTQHEVDALAATLLVPPVMIALDAVEKDAAYKLRTSMDRFVTLDGEITQYLKIQANISKYYRALPL